MSWNALDLPTEKIGGYRPGVRGWVRNRGLVLGLPAVICESLGIKADSPVRVSEGRGDLHGRVRLEFGGKGDPRPLRPSMRGSLRLAVGFFGSLDPTPVKSVPCVHRVVGTKPLVLEIELHPALIAEAPEKRAPASPTPGTSGPRRAGSIPKFT